jgi:hypothetical protein
VDKQLEMNPVSKMFFGNILAWMTKGAPLYWKLRGTPKEIEVFVKVLKTSKQFQEELVNPGATIDSVMEILNQRSAAKAEFKQVTGKEWPL